MRVSFIKFVFLSLLCFSFLVKSAPLEGEDDIIPQWFFSSVKPCGEEDLFPLLAFKITPPQKNPLETEIYLAGSIHTFPYEKYPDCLKRLIEEMLNRNFLLVLEHGGIEDSSFLFQTEEDEPWSVEAFKAAVADAILNPKEEESLESIFRQLEERAEYKFPYALTLSIMSREEALPSYDNGLDEVLAQKFTSYATLETMEECLDGFLPFKSFSEFSKSLSESKCLGLQEENEQEENPTLSYQEAFSISSLEQEQKKDREESQNSLSALRISEEKHIERNRLWATRLPNILSNNDKIFIAVGLDHLLSQNGLLFLLQQQGYALERLLSDGKFEPFTYKPEY